MENELHRNDIRNDTIDEEASYDRRSDYENQDFGYPALSTHPCDTAQNSPDNSSNDLSVTFSSSSYEPSKQPDEKSILYQESPTSIKPPQLPNNQQITFREDTNVLRERERRKLQQNRNEESDGLPLQRTNSEYEIMRQPSCKSDLTREERYRMGGTEYRALEALAWLVPLYFIGFIILFGFFFRIYIACSTYAQNVLATSNSNGPVEPWIFCFFMSLSSFTNLGLNHLDSSLIPFRSSPAPLLLAVVLILAGNTAFAIFLRFIIWICYILTPKRNIFGRETFKYLLDHPRRCYTTLFPSTQTWWLFIVLVAITLFELVCFIALNYWLPVLADMDWGARFLDALFQSVATRNAGFSVVSLAEINPAAQLVYIVAMYISVYPVAISMRNSNIYQERALGIFRGEEEEEMKFSEEELSEAPFIKLKRHATMTSIAQNTKKLLKGPDFFVITQIQRQLTSDICWVITGIFCILALEAKAIMEPSPVTISTVIYECVSAFGNVGASTGFPDTATSQSAQYRVLSLPASIDRSILLPSDELAQKEREDAERRRNTVASLQLFNDTGASSATHYNHVSDHLIQSRSCTL
ncbi:cation transport protein-domain-containing protein [Choanephora cucurbitarum]|nr:cation transport protein-domain-containing protein [Choanephora cucurbitarum]